MPKFTVYAVLIQDLHTEIEADTLEEAERIADEELITDDFDVAQAEFKLEMVCPSAREDIEKEGGACITASYVNQR